MAEFPIPSFLENMSLDEIHGRMLEQLPYDIDKSEGGHPWNLTRPTAYISAYMAEFVIPEAIKLIWPKYAENYTDVMLDHAEARGITRKAATKAVGQITVTGKAGTEIPVGTPFSTASVNGEPAVEFVTTEAVTIPEAGKIDIEIEAVEAGTIGNVPEATIILKANKITGISTVTNAEETTGGTEAESIESLQARIADYDLSQGASYVGSEADYRRWALEVDGTGDVVIIPAQDDSGLVTIVVTDAAGNPANEDLCSAIYNHIIRPDAPSERLTQINAGNLLVIPPETIAITISVTIESDGSVSNDGIKENILNAMKSYLFEATEEGKVRYTRIASIISGTQGVEDYNSLLLNGSVANIIISNQQLPVVEESDLYITFGTDISPDAPSSGGEATQEEIEEAIEDYLAENPLETQLQIDETLKFSEDGTLGVNTTEEVEAGNELPVTSDAVHKQVDAIDTALEEI